MAIATPPDARSRFLVLRDRPRSPAAEAYRSLRTSVQFLPPEKQRAFLITSSVPSEGKTSTAVNVGLAFASAGRRVLLVDADMRRPMLHRVFGLGKVLGLSHVLSSQADLSVIQSTDVPNLDVLPVGPLPPNPSELLGLGTVDTLLTECCARYDHVVFDTPPLLGVTDAVVLSRHVGRAILVLRAGLTSDKAVQRALELLSEAKAEVLGVVLNDLSRGQDGYGYYYHHYADGQALNGDVTRD